MFSTAVWLVIVLVVIYLMYIWMAAPTEGFYYKTQLPPHAMPEQMSADKMAYTLGGGFERL